MLLLHRFNSSEQTFHDLHIRTLISQTWVVALKVAHCELGHNYKSISIAVGDITNQTADLKIGAVKMAAYLKEIRTIIRTCFFTSFKFTK